MKRIPTFLIGALVLSPAPSLAADSVCSSVTGTCSQKDLLGSVGNITSTLLTVAGAIAVIVIIIGGLAYITSSGDSGRTKLAKDTILYAIIGLIVIIVAYAIVHFIIGNVK